MCPRGEGGSGKRGGVCIGGRGQDLRRQPPDAPARLQLPSGRDGQGMALQPSLYRGIQCNIKYVNIPRVYFNMLLIYVNMQHNYLTCYLFMSSCNIII